MNSLLEMMMPMAVFLQVKSLEKQGGPSPEDMAKIQETSDMLGCMGITESDIRLMIDEKIKKVPD